MVVVQDCIMPLTRPRNVCGEMYFNPAHYHVRCYRIKGHLGDHREHGIAKHRKEPRLGEDDSDLKYAQVYGTSMMFTWKGEDE